MYIMVLGVEDLVFFNDSDGTHAGGYTINSKLLQNLSPICSISQGGGGSTIGSVLNGLAVPAGLLLLQQQMGEGKKSVKIQKHGVIEDGLYEKIFALANETKQSKKQSKKLSNKQSKKQSKKHSKENKTKKRVNF